MKDGIALIVCVLGRRLRAAILRHLEPVQREAVHTKELAPLALPHRLMVKPESQLRGRDAAAIVAEILARTPLDIGEQR